MFIPALAGKKRTAELLLSLGRLRRLKRELAAARAKNRLLVEEQRRSQLRRRSREAASLIKQADSVLSA